MIKITVPMESVSSSKESAEILTVLQDKLGVTFKRSGNITKGFVGYSKKDVVKQIASGAGPNTTRQIKAKLKGRFKMQQVSEGSAKHPQHGAFKTTTFIIKDVACVRVCEAKKSNDLFLEFFLKGK